MEDESGDDQTEENSDDAIADVVEIGVGRVSLKDAVKECEGDLQVRIADPFASGGHPASNARSKGDYYYKRRDRFYVRHQKHDRKKRERTADHATEDSQRSFVERRLSAFERDERASDERGVDSRLIDRRISDVTKHRWESDFERELHMRD